LRVRLQNSYRVATAAILVAWLWDFYAVVKSVYYAVDYPLVEDFFPWPFASPVLLPVLYLIPAVLLVPALRSNDRRFLTIQACCLVVCSAWLSVHKGAFWSETFCYGFWVGLWMLWVARRLDDSVDDGTLRSAALLAQLLLAMIFLTRSVGTWTSEYWSGEMFYDVFFRYQHTDKFLWLRDMFQPKDLSVIATVYGRLFMLAQAVLFLVVFLPSRWAFPISAVVLSGLWAATTLDSIAWIAPLLGLALAGVYLTRESRQGPGQSADSVLALAG
jgi:hypothetical protein